MDKKKKRQEILIKICCLALSFIVWLYINNFVNPIKNVELNNVPVQLTNTNTLDNDKLVLVPNQKFSVNIIIKGSATDVYGASTSQFKIVADLSSYLLKKGENNIPVRITKKPSQINILNSETLFVKVYLDAYEEKTVPISVKLIGETESGYAASEPEYTPQSVVVSGAAAYVENVNKVIAEADIKNANKELKQYVSLKAYDSNDKIINDVNILPKVVQIKVPILKTKTVSVNVITTGQKPGEAIKTVTVSPEKIDISGNANILDKITALDTLPIDISSEQLSSIQTKLVVPDGIKLINSNGSIKVSITVDRIINKNVTVNIKNKNLSDKYTASVDITSENIVVSGLESVIDKLSTDSIECYLDFNSLVEGEYDLQTNLTLQNGVTKVSVSSEKVHVKISKK